MKKSFAIILLGLLVSSIGYSQKTYTFEYKIHPERTYVLEMDIASNNETTVSDVLTKNESLSKVRRTTTTKAANAEGLFPTIMAFDDVRMLNEGKEVLSPLSYTIIEGLMAEDNKFKIDTIINPKLDKVTRDALKTVFKDLKPEIDFPKKPMKIGDGFSQDSPLTVPVNGQKIKLLMTKTYTLKGVLNGIAEFSIKMNFALAMSNENITAIGDGGGVVLFNIAENQVVKDDTHYTVNIKVKTPTGIELGYVNAKAKKNTVIN